MRPPILHRRCHLRVLRLAILLAVVPGLLSGAAASPAAWTVDDILHQERVCGKDLSADGRLAVWVVCTVAKEDGEERASSTIHAAVLEGDLAGDESLGARKLTRGRERIRGLALSPDAGPGEGHLVFLTDRPLPNEGGPGNDDAGGAQLWALPLAGGEAFPVTRGERGVREWDWIDAETLLVAREETPRALEIEREEEDDAAEAIDDPAENPPVRLWKVGLDGEAERLTTDADWIVDLDVAPGGDRAVVYAHPTLTWEFDQETPAEAWIVDLETGERSPVDLAGSREAHSFAWAADGGSVYFADRHSTHPQYRVATVARLGRWTPPSDDGDAEDDAGTAEILDLEWPRGLYRGGPQPVEGGVVTLLADGVYNRPARLGPEGERRLFEAAAGALPDGVELGLVDDLEASEDGGTLLLEISGGNRPTQLFVARLNGADGANVASVRQLGKLNPSFDDNPLGEVTVVRFEGAQGDEVEGLLYHPLAGSPEERAPVIVAPHGGPAGHDTHAWGERWSYPNILWQQRGAYVLEVNYHGSSGYGLEWVESIEKRYYELEIPDLEAGVDHVLRLGESGELDPPPDAERLAVVGWSNGGILAAGLVTETDRYDAAIVGAADVEWISDWANVDFGASFDNYYFGGPPWERLEHYLEKSPFFDLPEVRTPVLVHTGTDDRTVPPHQSWSIFRVLQQVSKTDVRFVLYPDEGHGLRRIAHQRRKVEEDVAWLERHLFGGEVRPFEVEAAIPEGSRLESHLARHQAASHGGHFGLERDAVLVPELVEAKGVEGVEAVGRFEVTRAQWKAYDDAYEYAPGEGDHPVTGISHEEAAAYAEWLAKVIGNDVRLPTTKEAETLSKKAGEGGNVLDHWIGHAPNPDDANLIRHRLEEEGVSLLRRVGSHAPWRAHDDAPAVFDLDGNAAEWPSDGEPVGPSADRSSNEEAEPGSGYVGLRVVR